MKLIWVLIFPYFTIEMNLKRKSKVFTEARTRNEEIQWITTGISYLILVESMFELMKIKLKRKQTFLC